jgi:hypothetical protein
MNVTNIGWAKSKTRLLHGNMASEIYQDYLEPFMIEWATMKPRPPTDELNKMCQMPWSVWNTVVMEDFYPESNFSVRTNDITNLLPRPEMKGMIDFWSHRKRTDFGKFQFLFGECLFYVNAQGEHRCRADIRLPDSVVKIYGKYGEKSPFTQSNDLHT